jgi:hypothetical protein
VLRTAARVASAETAPEVLLRLARLAREEGATGAERLASLARAHPEIPPWEQEEP